MATRKLHGIPLSPPTLKVALALYEKNLDFECIVVDMRAGAHKHPSFLAKNPFGQVPMFEDSNVTLFESRAITHYLANTYKDQRTDLLCGCGKQGEVDLAVWAQVEAEQFNAPALAVMLELIFKPMFGLGPMNEATMVENEAKLCKVLDVYEARLAQKKYLSGDYYGLADLHHVPVLNNLLKTPIKKAIEECPHVSKWVEDILARPAWAKVLALQKSASE